MQKPIEGRSAQLPTELYFDVPLSTFFNTKRWENCIYTVLTRLECARAEKGTDEYAPTASTTYYDVKPPGDSGQYLTFIFWYYYSCVPNCHNYTKCYFYDHYNDETYWLATLTDTEYTEDGNWLFPNCKPYPIFGEYQYGQDGWYWYGEADFDFYIYRDIST